MLEAVVDTVWKRFWAWAGRVPLRTKMIGIVVSALSTAGFCALIWFHVRMSHLLQRAGASGPTMELSEPVFVIVLSIVGGFFVAWLLTLILTRPILETTWVARRVHQGDLSYRAPVWANDEMGELSQSFNTMIDRLISSQQALAESNQRLLARNEELSRLSQELTQRDVNRTKLLARSVAAQELERERISRELHDETGQALTSLLVQLKLLERLRDPSAIAQQAQELREIVVGTLEEVRRLARDLRPAMLNDLGLTPTLDGHIKAFRRKTNLDIEFEAVVSENLRLPRDVELALYRTAQEALTNVARHANASKALVLLEEADNLVSLSISDNGCGFDLPAVLQGSESGVGLLGIRERVELIGGAFQIDSAPGQGTRLRVDVEIKASEP